VGGGGARGRGRVTDPDPNLQASRSRRPCSSYHDDDDYDDYDDYDDDCGRTSGVEIATPQVAKCSASRTARRTCR
jgi:hypothetical protein